MARYPLATLLDARRYREEAAGREMVAAERRLADAREAVEEARRRLARHREWRPGEEERLFMLVRMKVLRQDELDAHRDDVQALGRRELELEEALRRAEEAVRVRQDDLDRAKQARLAAMHGREKIEVHRDRWLRVELLRREAAEEADLEEFNRVRDEDGGEDEWT